MKIPYEKQHDTLGNRMCGPAAMVMVLRSLNQNGFQKELWEEVKTPDGHGNYYSKCHKVCLSFLNRGLKSIHLSVVDPIQFLKLCQEHSIRVILGHRLEKGSTDGHFTVFTKITTDMVFVNDPDLGSKLGKGRAIPYADLLELMNGEGEIAKNSCLVISQSDLNCKKCPACKLPIHEEITCKNCNKKIPLQPTCISGCQNPDCDAKLTEFVFCPHCDMGSRLNHENG